MMTSVCTRMVFVLSLALPLGSLAADDWLVVGKDTLIHNGQTLVLDIVKPEHASWPVTLTVVLNGAGSSEEIVLAGNDEASTDANRRSYTLIPTRQYVGIVRAKLKDLQSNQFLLQAVVDDNSGPLAAVPSDESEPEKAAGASSPTIVLAQPNETPALTAHEPTYFIMGDSSERGTDARFQISFKYRMFDPEGAIGKYSPLLSNLYFSYTQTSLWDLGEDSSPFRDTSYRPGLFYNWAGSDRILMPSDWRTGIEHESNGRSGAESRSLNSAYLVPAWYMDMSHGRRLAFTPRINYYIDKNENRDIQRYRGYVDWMARYGREDGLIISGLYREGTAGYATGQIDLTYPISERIFARTGSFLHLQLFSGYGETLLDYNRHHDTQIRLGISIAR